MIRWTCPPEKVADLPPVAVGICMGMAAISLFTPAKRTPGGSAVELGAGGDGIERRDEQKGRFPENP